MAWAIYATRPDTTGNPGTSLKINLKGPYRGYWCDWATGQRGDALALIAACQDMTLKEAHQWALDFLNNRLPDSSVSLSPPRSQRMPPRQRGYRYGRQSMIVPVVDGLDEINAVQVTLLDPFLNSSTKGKANCRLSKITLGAMAHSAVKLALPDEERLQQSRREAEENSKTIQIT